VTLLMTAYSAADNSVSTRITAVVDSYLASHSTDTASLIAFPHIAVAFRKYNAAPASSAAVEMLFSAAGSVVKLPVIYTGGKLPVTYRPLLARLGHLALVLKGMGQSLGLNIFLAISLLHSEHFLDMTFATLVCN